MQEINFPPEELIASLPLMAQIPHTSPMPKENLMTVEADTDFSVLNISSQVNISNSENYEDYDEYSVHSWYRHSPGITAIFCVGYSLVFVLGILGNSFVVAVVLRSPRMRTVTNFFIVNLACADILVLLFCLPATLLGNIFVPWMLGLFMCKGVSYLQGVSVSASINTLVAISIDRFVAICYPLRCQMSTSVARRIIAIIWVFSLLITIPWAMYFKTEPFDPSVQDGAHYCIEEWPHDNSEKAYFFVANLGLCYALPLCIISMCYLGIWIKVWRRNIPGETKGTNADIVMQRSKLKVVKMMVVVVLLFAVSWLPLYIIFTMVKLGTTIEEDTWKEKAFAVMVPIAQWLGASNSCINPVLYTFCNKKFRKGFLAILRSRSCCGTLRYESAVHKGTKSTVLRSTFKSRCDTQCEYVSAQV